MNTVITALVTLTLTLVSHAKAEDVKLLSELPGAYERTPVENDWHRVTIERRKDGTLTWKNAAGKEWTLEPHNEGREIRTTKDSPYPDQQLVIEQNAAGEITGLQFNNETYRPVGGAAAGKDSKVKPTELVFGNRATLAGTLEQIKTYDDDGKAVFPYYLRTKGNLVVRAAPDFAPENADEEVDGMEVKMLGGDDSALEPYNGKTVTIRGQIGTGVGLYCFGFGLYVDGIKNIEVSK